MITGVIKNKIDKIMAAIDKVKENAVVIAA